MRILIVDDEACVARVLAEAVRLQGHDALVAVSGQEALTLIEQQHPDAVFLDIVMPQMSGIEVLRRIREERPALPVIVLSGRASFEQLEEARRLGVTDCLDKPFILNRLNEALAGLEGKRAQEGR